MSEKFLLVSLEEEQAKKLADVLSNKTARQILNYLSEHEEQSESDIAKTLKLPLTTVHYNIENLKKAELIEVKHFMWSEKGKAVDLHSVAKKFIVLSPKGTHVDASRLKNLLMIGGISGLGAIIAGWIGKYFFIPATGTAMPERALMAAETASAAGIAAKSEMALMAAQTADVAKAAEPSTWVVYLVLFCIGALFSMLVYSLLRWKKR